jgi:hypothetical protein
MKSEKCKMFAATRLAAPNELLFLRRNRKRLAVLRGDGRIGADPTESR